MEVKHLKLVKEVAEKGSLTKAMDSLFLSQSALSHQLKEVETQLGATLFHRINKKLVLTGAGKLVLESAERILHDLERTEISVKKYVSGNAGNVRVSTECYSCYHWLPPLMLDFKKEFPNVEIDILPEYALDPLNKILDGKLDLTITSATTDNPGLSFYPLITDEMVAIFHAGHQWAGKKYLEAEDFADQDVIIHSYPLETVTLFRDVLFPENVMPKKIIPMQVVEAAIEMVKAEMGVMVMAKWILEPYLGNKQIAYTPVTKRGLTRTWYAATLAGEKPQFLDNFICHLKGNIAGSWRI